MTSPAGRKRLPPSGARRNGTNLKMGAERFGRGNCRWKRQPRWEGAFELPPRVLGEDVLRDVPVDVGEAEIASGVPVGQTFVIEA